MMLFVIAANPLPAGINGRAAPALGRLGGQSETVAVTSAAVTARETAWQL